MSKYKNSNFNESNTPRDIFVKRFHELQDEHDYNYDDIADGIYVVESTIKQWMRKSGRNPSHQNMIDLAKFFDVDIGYLYGEQDCRKIESQRIVDLTGLSETSAAKLTDSFYGNGTLDSLLSNDDFIRLLYDIFEYTHSQFVDVETNNKSLPENNNVFTPNDIKAGYKTKCLETFSKIIDSLWDDEYDSMLFARDLNTITELLKEINEKYETAESIGDNARDIMYRIIELKIDSLEHKSFLFLKKYPPKMIYDHYKDIAEQLEIEL